jgi:hypothetical protein
MKLYAVELKIRHSLLAGVRKHRRKLLATMSGMGEERTWRC